jgi:hypothetical protein
MPQFSVRAFASDSNQMRSGSDYINRKKAATLYTTVSTNLKDEEEDNLAVLISEGSGTTTEYDISRCIWSVGGYNVNSYDLYLNVSKGRYYTATMGRGIGINPQGTTTSVPDISGNVYINDCSSTVIAPSTEANSKGIGPFPELERNNVGNIYDSTLLTSNNIPNIDSSCSCTNNTGLENLGIDVNLFSSTTKNLDVAGDRLARLAIAQPLRSFDFPKKFSIPRPSKK